MEEDQPEKVYVGKLYLGNKGPTYYSNAPKFNTKKSSFLNFGRRKPIVPISHYSQGLVFARPGIGLSIPTIEYLVRPKLSILQEVDAPISSEDAKKFKLPGIVNTTNGDYGTNVKMFAYDFDRIKARRRTQELELYRNKMMAYDYSDFNNKFRKRLSNKNIKNQRNLDVKYRLCDPLYGNKQCSDYNENYADCDSPEDIRTLIPYRIGI